MRTPADNHEDLAHWLEVTVLHTGCRLGALSKRELTLAAPVVSQRHSPHPSSRGRRRVSGGWRGGIGVERPRIKALDPS